MSDTKADAATSKKPVDNDFQQQRLRAWQPLLTPPWVIATFLVIGVLFVIIGGVCVASSNMVVMYTSDRYDVDDALLVNGPVQSWVNITIDKDMKAPVFVYYELTNFYQNHRRYVKSRSDDQLKGGTSTSSCDPLVDFKSGNSSNAKILYPCGLIANSFFNDTFSFFDTTLVPLFPRATGIAWKSDKEDKFKSRPVNTDETTQGPQGQLPAVDSEELMVWMRTAGLPKFKKLHRIFDTDLKAGTVLHIMINNTYRVSGFSGEKRIVISTTTWLGGKNDFLGLAYIVVGVICLFLGLVFFGKHKLSPRPLGDMKYFNWPGVASRPAGGRIEAGSSGSNAGPRTA